MERLTRHPILTVEDKNKVRFTFEGRSLEALEGEVISSALFANGIKIFSKHKKDSAPQGIFCANGQCSQCSVIADGLSVKACVTKVREGMTVAPLEGTPELPKAACVQEFGRAEELETDALIIGGGPSGLAAAAELGRLNVKTLVIDDKSIPGGKLVLQTHKFFGSVEDCYAGTRGIDIADKLEEQLKEYPSVTIWPNTTCLAVFSDKKAGVLRLNRYYLIRPKVLISATGAREKSLIFPGNTLPGVYGAGAFQTLVNRDLVRPAKRLFVVGGGNVGLIAAYHALQAGIKVVGLIEAMPACGGYKVHTDKIKRLGIPVYTNCTILRAEGKKALETVTVAGVDEKCRPVPASEKTFKADTLLIAVGLSPVNEFHKQALDAGIEAFICGDAEEIAEASAAMFSGKIAAHKALRSLGIMAMETPQFWFERLETLKSRPGKIHDSVPKEQDKPVYPVLHCRQEIPCNPCVTVCPKKSIKLSGDSIMSIPRFSGECIGCFKCLIVCPGLAVTLVDRRKDAAAPSIAVPLEIDRSLVAKGDTVTLTDWEGKDLGAAEITDIKDFNADNTLAVIVKAKAEIADRVASIKLFASGEPPAVMEKGGAAADDAIICRCERVTLGEIRRAIRIGVRDMNQIKAVTRASMGSCGAKTCESLILSVFRSEGVDLKEVTGFSKRPLFIETPLGAFTDAKCGEPNRKKNLLERILGEVTGDNSLHMSTENYDVIVIGAGSIGTPLAMFLAEKKLKTLVIEALPSVGQGQNKCAIGGIRATHSDGSKITAGLRSLKIFSTWQERYGDDIGWIKGGYLFPVYTESDETMLRGILKVQKKFGLNIDWIPPVEVAKRLPGVSQKSLRGGTFAPDDGSASPLLAVNAFYRRALQLGAEFRFNEEITGFIKETGAVKGVTTRKGGFRAAVTVNAAGARAAALSALAGVKVPVDPDCHEAGVTEPVRKFFEPMVVDIRPGDKSKNYYFYQNSEEQLVFCLTPNPPVWGADRKATSEFLPEISRRMINLIPALANIKVRRTWRGLYPMTPDGFPIAGFSAAVKGYALAAGMCGQGFMLGPGLGSALAAVIAGGKKAEDLDILANFSPERKFSGQEKLK